MTDDVPNQKGNSLDTYLVIGADADDQSRPDRRPWKRYAIYRSPICVAVHLSYIDPDCRDEKEVETVKAALFRYLRQVHQAVMEYGVIAPLAVVIEPPAPAGKTLLADALPKWGSDQAWHRGGFTLYLEPSKDAAKERLRDLLAPTGEAMDPKQFKPRDIEWYVDALDKAAMDQRTDPISVIAGDVLRLSADDLGTATPDGNGKTAFPKLETWRSDRQGEARRLEDQGGSA